MADLVDRIRQALGQPSFGELVESMQHASTTRGFEAMEQDGRAAVAAIQARQQRPRGFRPDGTRMTTADKRRIYERYEQLRDEFQAHFAAPADLAHVRAAMEPPTRPGYTCAWW